MKNETARREIESLDYYLQNHTDDYSEESHTAMMMAIKAVEQEPKTGHWKPYLKEGLRYQCSACDSRFETPWEYCPHCGAKMKESEDKI